MGSVHLRSTVEYGLRIFLIVWTFQEKDVDNFMSFVTGVNLCTFFLDLAKCVQARVDGPFWEVDRRSTRTKTLRTEVCDTAYDA